MASPTSPKEITPPQELYSLEQLQHILCAHELRQEQYRQEWLARNPEWPTDMGFLMSYDGVPQAPMSDDCVMVFGWSVLQQAISDYEEYCTDPRAYVADLLCNMTLEDILFIHTHVMGAVMASAINRDTSVSTVDGEVH